MFEGGSPFDSFGQVLASGVWIAPTKALLASFVFGQALAWVYEVTYRGLSYSRGFGQTVVLTCLAAAILVLSMSHSMVAGVGILGVLSMIRFRVTLKAPRDLVFVMGAATIGVACGVDSLMAGATGTIAFVGVALYLHFGTFGSRTRFDGVLRFRIPTEEEVEPRLSELLDRYCRRRTLLSVSEVAQGARVERAYQVKFWKHTDREHLLTALRQEFATGNARLLLQEATLEY